MHQNRSLVRRVSSCEVYLFVCTEVANGVPCTRNVGAENGLPTFVVRSETGKFAENYAFGLFFCEIMRTFARLGVDKNQAKAT